MCDYCDKGVALVTGVTNDQGISLAYPKRLMAYGYDVHGVYSNGLIVNINYCPMCGKLLDPDGYVKGVLPTKSGNYIVRYKNRVGRDDFTVNGNHWWNVGELHKPEEIEWKPDSYREL